MGKPSFKPSVVKPSVFKPPAPPAVPAPGEGKRGVEGHLGYLLRQASGTFRGSMERALAELGVTPPQFVVLTMIEAYPGLSNADLARLTYLTPQTLSLIVSNLKRAGAVTSRPHAIHGRIRQLEVSAAGRATLTRCKRRVRDLEQKLAAGLSAKDEAVVRRWLTRVAMESVAE